MQNIPISIVIPSLGDKKVIKVIDFLKEPHRCP